MEHKESWKTIISSSTLMSLALLGDALIYAILPVYAENFGLTIPMVGILLAANRIVRIHAPFVSDSEIEKINNFLRSQEEPDYVDEILNFADEKEMNESSKNQGDKDELYNLKDDPWELHNVCDMSEHSSIRSELSVRLGDWSIETEGDVPSPLPEPEKYLLS